MCFHYAACALRQEFQREAAWYGIAFFHFHPSWVDTWEDDAIVKKLLGLNGCSPYTEILAARSTKKTQMENKLNVCFS